MTDASRMDSASFFAAAGRLPFYDGAVAKTFARQSEEEKARPKGVATLQQLQARSDLQARDGWAPVFEITKIPRASAPT